MDPLRPKGLHMIRYTSDRQLSLQGFAPFADNLDPNNRWVVMGRALPWDQMASIYHQALDADQGRPATDARQVIGVIIIKHKLGLSDRETLDTIAENPYMQWFCGLAAFSTKPLFDASLLVTLRKRLGAQRFDRMDQAIMDHVRPKKVKQRKAKRNDDEHGEPPTHKGELKIDATIAPQKIAYPTDLGLLNSAREITERMIDDLSSKLQLAKKPRTYRRNARKDFLCVIRKKKRTHKEIRKAIGKQLRYLRRNLHTIDALWTRCGTPWPLDFAQLRTYWVVQHMYAQQAQMHRERSHRVQDRIVSIHQPHVRPMVRGKAAANVEFGAKLCVALCDGVAWLDNVSWDAHNEAELLTHHVERYKQRYGYYPQAVNVDGIYGTRENRAMLKDLGIGFIGKPLGRPSTESLTAKAKRKLRKAMAQRNHIEGKFGQAKNGYGLDRVAAQLKTTSESWIAAIFLVMNLTALSTSLKHAAARFIVLIDHLLGDLARSCADRPTSGGTPITCQPFLRPTL